MQHILVSLQISFRNMKSWKPQEEQLIMFLLLKFLPHLFENHPFENHMFENHLFENLLFEGEIG